MKTYELSITKTSHEVTTVLAETPEDARRACEAFHSPDTVEIHSVQEIETGPQTLPASLEIPCEGCRYDDDFENYYLGCSHPENSGEGAEFWTNPERGDCFTEKVKPDCPSCLYNVEDAEGTEGCSHPDNDGDWTSEFWGKDVESCFQPKLPVIQPGDVVIETTETCASCGGVMMKSGENEWCSVCASLLPPGLC